MSIFSALGSALRGTPQTVQPVVDISYALFESYAHAFGVHCAESANMLHAISIWNAVYQRSKTQVMKLVCKEAAKLTLTDLSLTIEPDQNNKATALFTEFVSNFEAELQRFIEQGIALGGLMLKPSETGIIFVSPLNFVPIAYDSHGNINSVIFVEHAVRGGMLYTKLEYHHRDADRNYVISTLCFKSKDRAHLGYACMLSEIPEWEAINAQVIIEDLDTPLYTYFRMPGTNNIDEESNCGLSLCSSALEYITTFDDTFKLFKKDLELSQKKVFVDDTLLIDTNKNMPGGKSFCHNPLPDLMVGIVGGGDSVKIFDPKSAVDDYKTALQLLLNMISTACGFTSGYFTFTADGGVAVTATQIESEDQVTVSTVVAIRKNLENAIKRVLLQQAKLLMLYSDDNIAYNFTFYARDLSATPIADREHTMQLVKDGLYPLRLYLKEYEGLSDDEITAFLAERAANTGVAAV